MGRHRSKETSDFMKSYEEKCQEDIKYKDAYKEAEDEYRDKNGKRKYKNLESFKSYRSQITLRDRGGRKS